MDLEHFLESVPHLVAMGVLIAMSGCISGGETAIYALSRHQLHRLRQSPRTVAQLALRLRENPRSLLSTILLSNITVNTLLYSMLAVTVTKLGDGSPLWTPVLGVLGFAIVLTFAEIGPKLAALSACERLAPLVAGPIRLLEIATLPVRWVLETIIVEPLTRVICGADGRPGGSASSHSCIRAEELQRLVRLSQMEGLIDERENAIIHRVVDLKDLRVGTLMVPRVDIIAFNLKADSEQLVRLITTSRLARIPVYEGDIDGIQGVIDAKEFLLNRSAPLRQLLHPARFIPEQAGVEALLQHFRSTGSKSAVVVDEYGGVAGIVALEDVVETIVGEFHAPDEAVAPPGVHRLSETSFLVDASLPLDEFGRAFELPIEETRVNTVGGLIAQMLDRIPQRGDQVSIGPGTLRVESMRSRRILQARLDLKEPPADNPDLLMLQEASLPRGRRSAPGEKEGEA